MNAQFKGHLMGALAGVAIVLLLKLITGCGRDEGGGVPVLQADPSTGAVTVKGDKGDQGEKGEPGPAGKDGADGKDASPKDGTNGRDGKDGKDAVVDSTWRDPATGKRWLRMPFLAQWTQLYTIGSGVDCSPWKIPTPALLQAAVNHGLSLTLKGNTQTSADLAWSSDESTTDAFKAVAVPLYSMGSGAILKSATHHVYCVDAL
jgi:hypothetical protein